MQPIASVDGIRTWIIKPDGNYWLLYENNSPDAQRFVTKLSVQVAASTIAKQHPPSRVRLHTVDGGVEIEWSYGFIQSF